MSEQQQLGWPRPLLGATIIAILLLGLLYLLALCEAPPARAQASGTLLAITATKLTTTAGEQASSTPTPAMPATLPRTGTADPGSAWLIAGLVLILGGALALLSRRAPSQ